MDMPSTILQILGLARQMRDHMWAEHKEASIQTQLSVLRQGHEEWDTVPDAVMALASMTLKDTNEVVNEVLQIPKTWDSWNGYKMIIFVTDGYGRQVDGLELTEVADDNMDLETEFKSDPHTDVTRMCVVCVAQDDLVGGVEAAIGFQQWAIDDGGVIVYGPPIIKPEFADNALINVMKEAINDRP